jgi:hypothetical protein
LYERYLLGDLQLPTEGDKTKMTPWEMLFILFAGAFTLEEYTASTDHGWISELFANNVTLPAIDFQAS